MVSSSTGWNKLHWPALFFFSFVFLSVSCLSGAFFFFLSFYFLDPPFAVLKCLCVALCKPCNTKYRLGQKHMHAVRPTIQAELS